MLPLEPCKNINDIDPYYSSNKDEIILKMLDEFNKTEKK